MPGPGTPPDRARSRRQVVGAAVLGATGSVAVAAGASQPASPYAFKGLPYAWFFGVPARAVAPSAPAPAGAAALAAIVAVLVGMALLSAGWLWLVRLRLAGARLSWAAAVAIAAAWTLPLLACAPVLSRDVYTYAAQGQMVSLGISPYRHGPAVLGASRFAQLTDPIWRPSASPYGPAFLGLDGLLVSWCGHSVLATVVALRLVELAGVAAAAAGAGLVARQLGADPVAAVLLVACSPLVLLHLVGGAHNDALMVGLLALGIAAAGSRHLVRAVLLCSLAAAVKLPAALGLVFVGWGAAAGAGGARRHRHRAGAPADDRSGPALAGSHRRLAAALAALAAGALVIEALAAATGLGWGFVRGLSNAGVVHLWLDPPTGVGMALGKLLALAGLHVEGAAITFSRGAGMALAAAVVLVLLWRSSELGLAASLGAALLVAAVLDSAIEPWYLSWGLVLLAGLPQRSARALVLSVSVLASFLGVPVGSVIVHQLEASSVAVAAAGAVALLLGCALLCWWGWSHLVRPALAARPGGGAYRGGGERVG